MTSPLKEPDKLYGGVFGWNPKPEAVTVIDRPCGSGKTTSILQGLRSDRQYLVIVPLLSEVERFIRDAIVPFVTPQVGDGFSTKTDSLRSLLEEGKNIVATHALFSIAGELAGMGYLNGYDVIIDEVIDVVGQVDGVTKTSWQRFYVGPGYVEVDDGGKVTATGKWDEVVEEVSDTLDPRLYHLAKAEALYVVDGTFYLWCLPPELVTSGRTITIYSYLANGALMLAYLRRLGVEFEHVRDLVAERRFRGTAKKLITIKTIRSLEGMAFSYTGQTSKKESKEERSRRAKKIAKALMNVRQRELADAPLETVMITCAKENWFDKPGSEKSKAGPYAANSRMFNKVNWVANTTRGTNRYIHCRTAIYLWDQHLNPYVRRWLGLGEDRLADDQYAITELIQWLYRTGVRRGEKVTVYMPSARMRRLLASWLDGEDVVD